MAYEDSSITFKARVSTAVIEFEQLLTGRTFIKASPSRPDPNCVWIKLDKNRAQPINETNLRIAVKPSEHIREVILRNTTQDSEPRPIAPGVVCKCPESFCPMHGRPLSINDAV